MNAPLLWLLGALATQGEGTGAPPTPAVTTTDEEAAAALGVAAMEARAEPDARARRLLTAVDLDVAAAKAILQLPNVNPLAMERKRAEFLKGLRQAETGEGGAGAKRVGPPRLSPGLGLKLLQKLEQSVQHQAAIEPVAALAAEHAADAARARLDAVRAAAAAEAAQSAAKEATNAAEEEVLQKVAAIEKARERVANANAQLLERAREDLETLNVDRQRSVEWMAMATAPSTDGAALADLLQKVIAEQDKELSAVMAAIEERARVAASATPAGLAGLTADQVEFSTSFASKSDVRSSTWLTLRESLAALQNAQERFERERKERWLDVASAHFDVAETLHRARLATIDRLGPLERADRVGLTSGGVENLRVVAKFVWVDLRLHHQRRVHDVAHLPQTLSNPLILGPLAWKLSLALVVLFLVAWVWRRADSIRMVLIQSVRRRVSSPRALRATEAGFLFLDAVSAPVAVILLAIWLNHHLGAVVPNPERTVVIEVAYWWAAYFALARLTHLVIVRFARGRFSMTVRKKLKVLRSVRFALRYAFVAIYLLRLLSGLLGAGPAMTGAYTIAGIGMTIVLLRLVRRWSEEIHDYGAQTPPGSFLFRLLESSRGRWYSFLAEAVGAVALTALAIGSLLRSFLMGFDQVRKMGAFVFRIRVEREAQRKGKTKFDLESVPDEVKAAFDETTVDPNLVIEHTAELETALAQICTPGDERLSIVVHAPYGVGRATWMGRLKERLNDRGHRVVVYRPQSRILGAGKLAAQLGRCLDDHPAVDTPDESSVDAIVEVLNACEEKLVVIVDGLEWLFLRTVNGYRAVDALVDIMHRTHQRVSFVLSAPTSAFHHLDRVRTLSSEVSRVLMIPRFTEAQIRELILRRQRSSGVEVSFEDLLVQNMDGIPEAAQVVENEEGYMRLLWTFSEGLPRVAMHFWLRSLVPDPEKAGALAVQLYDAPSADDLESIPERDRFLLQAIVLHRALTVDQVAATCDVRRSQAQAHIHRGLELGLYTEFDGTPVAKRCHSVAVGAYCVDVHFWEAAVRFLRRKKLL